VIHEFPGTIVEEEPTIEDPSKKMVVAPPVVVSPEVTQAMDLAPVASRSKNKKVEESMLRYQKYSYVDAHEGHFTTKAQLITSYAELKKKSVADTQKHYLELRKLYGSQTSLITVRDLEKNSLNLAIIDEEKVAEV